MKLDPNAPAYPQQDWDPAIKSQRRHFGLTIRAELAARMTFTESDYPSTTKEMEVMMGRKAPSASSADASFPAWTEVLKYHAEFEAKVRLIKADALIAEINREAKP